jgi:hypothetical protein
MSWDLAEQTLVTRASGVQYANERLNAAKEHANIERLGAVTCCRLCRCTEQSQLRCETLAITHDTPTARC